MFRAPLRPSSGAQDDSVGYHIGRLVLELLLDGSLSAGRMDIHPACTCLHLHLYCHKVLWLCLMYCACVIVDFRAKGNGNFGNLT